MKACLACFGLVFLAVGCGGSGGGSGGSSGALFGGPLMFINAQLRIYGTSNLQLADFNHDGLPELLYEQFQDSNSDIRSLLVSPGSETELFAIPILPGAGSMSVIADFDNDGNLDIASFAEFDSRGVPSFDWSLQRGNGDNTFGELEPFELGSLTDFPVGAAPADIDGDGFEDLLSLGYSSGEILPLVNQGDGTFEPADPVQAISNVGRLFSADLNHDTFSDILLCYFNGAAVALSNGDGTFGAMEDVIPVPAEEFVPPVDLNNDGNVDLVGGGPDGIEAYLGIGDGTFASELVSPLSPPLLGTTVLAAADFNEDSIADLVVTGGEQVARGQEPRLGLVLGRGDGTFEPAIETIDAITSNRALTLDADGDGNLDLLVANSEAGAFLRIYLGNGDGTFLDESSTFIDAEAGVGMVTEMTRPGNFSTQPLDVDDDGNLDLLVRNNTGSGDLSLFLGNGDGTFASERRVPLGNVRIQQTSDLDGDGLVDFFGHSMSLAFGILRNYGGGNLQPLSLIPVSLTTTDFDFRGAYDLDRDGLLDPMFWFSGGDIRVFQNLGNMQFEPLMTVANLGNEAIRAIADVTGDGYLDIVSEFGTNTPISQFFVRPGGPGFTFGPAVTSAIPRPTGSSGVIGVVSTYDAADFNGDGRADFALMRDQANNNGERTVISLLHGQADGSLLHVQDAFVPWVGVLAKAIDLDLDDDLDLAVASVTLSDLIVLTPARLFGHALVTNASGTFELVPGVQGLVGDLFEAFDADIVDITGDGFPDALTYSESIGLIVAIGQGDGTFGQPFYFRTAGGTEPAIGDFDNDGDGDFAAIVAGGGMIELLENRLVQE